MWCCFQQCSHIDADVDYRYASRRSFQQHAETTPAYLALSLHPKPAVRLWRVLAPFSASFVWGRHFFQSRVRALLKTAWWTIAMIRTICITSNIRYGGTIMDPRQKSEGDCRAPKPDDGSKQNRNKWNVKDVAHIHETSLSYIWQPRFSYIVKIINQMSQVAILTLITTCPFGKAK
jgi:hypothetical protein